jgi:starch phosphorylase
MNSRIMIVLRVGAAPGAKKGAPITISAYYLIPPLPEGLVGLAKIGLDLRWSWSHANDPLWKRLNPELWNLTRNPWLILQSISSAHLEALVGDADFRKQLNEQVLAH